MDINKLNFIQQQFVPLAAALPAESKGKWGKMNAQQMVEHVTGFFKVSAGKIHFDIVSPEEHWPKLRAFLYSEKEFRENTKAPLEIVPEEPLMVRTANMETAIAALQKSIDDFILYFKDDPLKTTTHPVFAHLNFEEWVLLHYKHLQHHGKQFGLV
ncbi:MAG: DUF1569 domain-containing protein [Bacteroidetes bacterium]|nr:DUF1569 domain-containing protein [Bacteroidota bacterium]